MVDVIITDLTYGTEEVSIYMLRRATRKLRFFSSAQAWRPAVYEGDHSSFVPPTTAAAAVATSTPQVPVAYRSSLGSINIILWKALYQARGGGVSLPSPVLRFMLRGGKTSLPSPVSLYSGGRRLSTVPYVCLYIAGGDGSLPFPVFDFVYHRRGQLSNVSCV